MSRARRDLGEPLLVDDVDFDLFDALVVKENPGKTLLDSRNPFQKKNGWISRWKKNPFQKKNEWISRWKKNPHINPHKNLISLRKTRIIPSLDPKREYVRLYKEAIKSLIEEIKDPLHPLSSTDCEVIRKRLPDIHVYKYKEDGEEFSYDHLFAKYFLKKHKYTPQYSADEIDIFLYLELYNILKRKTITGLQGFGERDPLIVTDSNAKKNPFYNKLFVSRKEEAYLLKEGDSSSQFEFNHNTLDFLINNIDHSLFMNGGISIYNIMEKLCKDIKEILYIDITSLNKEKILKLKTNLKVLKFVYHIYKVANFNKETLKFTDDLYSVVKDEKEKFGKKLTLIKTEGNHGMLFIYRIIINSILNYDKDIKSVSLSKSLSKSLSNKLEEYWKKYEEEENTIDNGIPLPSITKTLNEMNIGISESNFEINKFFNILIEIYNKIILLYEYDEPDQSTSSNKLKDILILSIDDDQDKIAKVKAKVEDINKLEIIGYYSLYLAIDLGNKDLTILFSYIIDNEESIFPKIPIFNCREKNENLMENFRNLNDRGVFILYRKIIELKKLIEASKYEDPFSIYNMYNEMYRSLIQSQGGRKKRIIKSKKNIKQKKGKKIIT
jgi:hypothetical protein